MKRVQAQLVFVLAAMLVLPQVAAATLETPYEIEWGRQIGTGSYDRGYGVAADGAGNIYVSGYTEGLLGGTYFGGRDAFLSKYNSDGGLLWARQLGTTKRDDSLGVSLDGLGNVYISGLTQSSLGGASKGGDDAFVAKYDSAGNLKWARQLGSDVSDTSQGVSADALGNVFVAGWTYGSLGGTGAGVNDAYAAKFDAAGNLVWIHHMGTQDSDYASGVSADGLGNVYVTGNTYGSIGGGSAGGQDVFVRGFNSAGILLWSRQLGTRGDDRSYGVSADALGNVFVAGRTDGPMGEGGGGGRDAFLSMLDSNGSLLWTRELGTIAEDAGFGVSADGLGNVFLTGHTKGSLGGTNEGNFDAFVSKYDSLGNLLWTSQFGTIWYDMGDAVAVDALGNVFVTGHTYGDLAGPNAGATDAFLIKLVPEPGTVLLLGLGGLALLRRRKARGIFRAK